MKALIDADNVAFACAASAEDFDNPGIACSRASEMLDRILQDTGADSYELWLSGPRNFRYKVYPEYKANRLDSYRPKWEKETKQFLVDNWQANWTDGIEGDDILGIRQTECGYSLESSIICHIDKDINQIPGWHYNWELNRLGKTIREKRQYLVTFEEALYNFYYQLLVGDPTDNIKGVSGIGPKKAEAILGSTPKEQWYETVRDMFASEEELEMNAQCVFIWRKHNDHWRNLVGN